MPYRQTSNNIKAGAFVIVSIILGVIIVILVSGLGRRFEATDAYLIHFDLATGAPGLDAGATVMIGGQPAGHVADVRMRDTDGDDQPDVIEVAARLHRGIPVFSNAVVHLERPLFGTGATINIPDLGGGENASLITDPERRPLRGAMAPPAFLTQAGFGDQQIHSLRNIITDLEQFTTRMRQIADRDDGTALVQIESLLDQLDGAVAEVRDDYSRWSEDADAIVANARTASSRAVDLFDHPEGVNQRARALLGTLGEIVDENRQSVDDIIENANATAETARGVADRVDREIMDQLTEAIAAGSAAADDARIIASDARALLETEEPSLRRAVASGRLAADQLRLMMGELRDSPWRLIYRPDTRELEYELLYDSARSYAAALSDLRAATESLEASLGRARDENMDPERLEQLLERLQSAYDGYEKAEQSFLDQLLERRPVSD